MWSSVICWIAGRRPSTRLKVNGFDSIRRNRVCSSASAVNTDRGRLCTVDNMPSFQCGKPGSRSSTLTRESETAPHLLVAGDEPRRAAVPDPDPATVAALRPGPTRPVAARTGSPRSGHRVFRDLRARFGGRAGQCVRHVSDLAALSFFDVDGLGGTRRGCLAYTFGLHVRRVLVEQNDDTVFVSLIEHLGRFITQFPEDAQMSWSTVSFICILFTRAASRAPAIGPRSRR